MAPVVRLSPEVHHRDNKNGTVLNCVENAVRKDVSKDIFARPVQ